MLSEEELYQFSGSDSYFTHWTGNLIYTNGVKYLADKGEAHWLIDAIASYQKDKRITKNNMLQEIQFWKLTVKDSEGVLTCVEDTGRKPVITQKIEFTDFPLESVDIFVESNGKEMVAMLPAER